MTVMAFYQFQRFDDLSLLKAKLVNALQQFQMKGTILVAHEGINGTIAGPSPCAEQMLAMLRTIPGLGDLTPKRSYCDEYPFLRSKVKIKQEIVTMGQPDLDPNQPGEYVSPEDWNALISDPTWCSWTLVTIMKLTSEPLRARLIPTRLASGISLHSLKKTSIPLTIKKSRCFAPEVFAARNPQRILSPRGSNLCTTFKAASCNT